LTDNIDKFLDQISEEAVLVTTNSFDNSIRELYATSTVTDVLSTAASCQAMLAAVEASPCDPSTALLVVDVLKGFSRLENYVELQMVDVRVSRSLVMFSAWNLFHWAHSIVQNSMRQKVINSWVDQLVSKVFQAITDVGMRQLEVTFSSADYLPNIDPPNEYLYRVSHYRLSWAPEDQALETYSVATAIIRQWMGLPEDAIYLARYTFLDTFLDMPHSPHALLYLDAVWEVYKNPPMRLLRGIKKNGRNPNNNNLKNSRNMYNNTPLVIKLVKYANI
jgi:hypothetical protein